MTNKKLTIISVSLLSIFLIATFATLRQNAQDKSLNQQKQTDNSDLSDLPIVDFSQSSLAEETAERKEKNKRFNYSGSPAAKELIKELPEGAEKLPTIVHWWVGLSALPVEKADAIVIGAVRNRAAYLSQDKTNVYSDYQFEIEKVLKDTTQSLKNDDIVSLIRYGGGVRFSSGKIQKYQINRQGTLKDNRRYLLFLKKDNDVDLLIVTGYEFSGNKVIPIDGQDNKDPRSALPFNKYLNGDVETFLKDVQTALITNENGEGTKQ